MKALARHYGASPVHLLAHLVALSLIAWVILRVVDVRGARDVLVWLIAALILHDLVLLPAYSGLDRAAQHARLRGLPLINHLRVPAIVSGLTLLVFFPLILGKADGNLRYVSGVQPTGYLGRWLAIVAVAWALSALILAVRLVRRDQLRHPVGPARDDDGARG